jgi:hypothetical protein
VRAWAAATGCPAFLSIPFCLSIFAPVEAEEPEAAAGAAGCEGAGVAAFGLLRGMSRRRSSIG